METSATIQITREPADVFDFTTSRVEDWSEIVVSDLPIDETPEGVGSTFLTVTQDRGTRMEFQGVVTVHDPPVRHAISMTGKQFDLEVDYQFKEVDGGTEVTQVSVVKPKGLIKIFFVLFGWMMKKSGCLAARKELENLKRILEDETKSQN